MSIRRRRTDKGQRPYKKYDFLAEVESDRLMYIGAITLAWNWIEGALDTCVAIALEIHPDMWTEVTSRINGMEGKFELLKKTLGLDGYPKLPEDCELAVRRSINAVADYKKLRDGIIHVKLIHPEATIADTVQRKGITDEVLVSEEALRHLYNHLQYLAEEVDWLPFIYLLRYQLSEAKAEDDRQRILEELMPSMALHQSYQAKRASLPPLPEFPEEPPTPLGPEAAQ